MYRPRHRGSIREPEMTTGRVRLAKAWPLLRIFMIGGIVAACVLVMVFFGFPFIQDIITGTDPTLRYQPEVEADFSENLNANNPSTVESREMYLTDFPIKNEPYINGERIIFTTRYENRQVYELDTVVLYDTTSGEAKILNNVDKKYDNLLQPVLSGNIAVWLDSMLDGGGRIVGYDLNEEKQFTIKDYGYAMPKLSISGDLLAFMQWAGDTTQRLYVYNVRTREPVTVKVYSNNVYGNSAVSISSLDMVWSEYGADGLGILKRIVFADGNARYENYDLRMSVFEPKTNGRDIVFSTEKNTSQGSLMLSTNGGKPVMIADHVTNYGIGNNFVVYTKEDTVYVCFTNEQNAFPLTSEIAKALLSCVDGNGITYYDVTDGVLADEVVMYGFVK